MFIRQTAAIIGLLLIQATALLRAEALPAVPEPAESVRVQLMWHHQFEFAGFYAAAEKGFYRRHGLNVELLEAKPETSVVDEVISGRAEYGVGNAELLLARGRGQPVVLMANLFKHSPLVILARRDSGIRSPRDLIGKRLMTRQADLNSAEISFMLNREQIRPEQLTIVPHNFRIDSLLSNQVDAMTVYITNQPLALKDAGVDPVILDPANYGGDFYSNTLFTDEDELRQHPERVRAFHQATLEGWRYALEHPEEIVRLIHNRYRPQKSLAALYYEARETAKLISADIYPLGSIDPRRLQRVQEVYLRKGSLSAPLDLNALIWSGARNDSGALPPLPLTAQEQKQIARLGRIRVCAHPGYLPYEGIRNGKMEGIAVDLLRLSAESLGMELSTVLFQNHEAAVQGLKDGQCDLMVLAPHIDRLLDDLLYTRPYLNLAQGIVMQRDQPFVSDLQALDGKRLGVVRGGEQEASLIEQLPQAQLRSFETIEAGLQALADGELDAFIDAANVTGFYLRQLGLEQLQVAGVLPDKFPLMMGVDRDQAALRALLDKALQAIPEAQKQQIMQRWIEAKIAEEQTDFRLWLHFALILLLLLAGFMLLYRRLRGANLALISEVEQRRAAEAGIRAAHERLQQANDELELLARTDALTGLRNRYSMELYLEETMLSCDTRQQQLTVVLIDIDHFKSVNGRFGHHTGDSLLRRMARLLVRDDSAFSAVGRWGGEEFILVLAGQGSAEAFQLAESVRQVVAAADFAPVESFTISCGLAQMEPGETLNQLVGRADQALYRAKAEGRNCTRVAPESLGQQRISCG